MVIDSSAILAILLNEPEALEFQQKITQAEIRLISAATLFEASIVAEGRLGKTEDIDLWFKEANLLVQIVDEVQANLARDAWRRFGKGRHPAGLNFGDCFSYALAKSKGEKLLFKGSDFSQTDILAA
jgi:ribonuclease VapC